jgi:hypothetical protein
MKDYILMMRHLWDLLVKVAQTSFGWLSAVIVFIFNYFSPEGYSFSVVLVAVLLDAFFGILVALKFDKFILSKLGRVTLTKMASYAAPLIMLYMIEKLTHDSGFIGIKVAAGWAAACELWSMSAHILILWPDSPFFKLFRKQLKAEIEAKIGNPLDDIFTDEEKKD